MNAYTQIVAVIAVPAQALPGQIVNVYVDIKSIYQATIHTYCVGVLDSENRFIDWLDYWIGPEQTKAFDGQFTMPNHSVVVNIYSYYEAGDGSVVKDDSKSVNVVLVSAPPPTPTTGWQQLDYGTITIAPTVTSVVTWQMLDSGTITVTPTVSPTPSPTSGWQNLDSGIITIAPTVVPAVGWIKLDSKVLKVGGEGLNKYLPWIAGIAAGGLVIYAVKKSQED